MEKSNLRHLAMILDGNRRWGKKRGLKMNIDFYLKSGLLGFDIARAVFDRGIPNLTIWIGSVSNLTERPAIEIAALNKAYKKFFSDQENLDFAHENQIKIDCFGRWRELLKSETVTAIEKTLAETEKYSDSGKRLTVLIGYDGSEERGAAVEKLLASADDISSRADSFVTTKASETEPRDDAREGTVRGKNSAEKRADKNVSVASTDNLKSAAKLLRANSWTGHLPDVDLIIRTGCGDDPHNSAGFLSLLTDNSQYAFLRTLWPDFTPTMLNQVLDDFGARQRRFGE